MQSRLQHHQPMNDASTGLTNEEGAVNITNQARIHALLNLQCMLYRSHRELRVCFAHRHQSKLPAPGAWQRAPFQVLRCLRLRLTGTEIIDAPLLNGHTHGIELELLMLPAGVCKAGIVLLPSPCLPILVLGTTSWRAT